MKKLKYKIILIIVIITFIALIIGKIEYKNSIDKRFLNNEYNSLAVLLKIGTMQVDNSKYITIVDGSYNNSVTPKDNYLILINSYIGVDGIEHIIKAKTISNKKYEKIRNQIENIEHYYEYINSDCYDVKFRNEEHYYIKASAVKLKF